MFGTPDGGGGVADAIGVGDGEATGEAGVGELPAGDVDDAGDCLGEGE